MKILKSHVWKMLGKRTALTANIFISTHHYSHFLVEQSRVRKLFEKCKNLFRIQAGKVSGILTEKNGSQRQQRAVARR